MSALLACAAVAALASGCSSPAAPGSAASRPASSASPGPSKAVLAAQSAARLFFALYGAKQYKPAYELLLPAVQKVVPERTWVRVNQKCKTVNANYKIAQPFVQGNRAVVDMAPPGAASSLTSKSEIFIYSGGHWLFVPDDISAYEHHTVPQIVAALKAQKVCK
jgi:hypothetical protein